MVGNNNETIGEINDVLMDAKGQVAGVIIGVGGFLGMGEKDVAIPMNALRFDASTNGASNTTGTVAAPPVNNPATTTAPERAECVSEQHLCLDANSTFRHPHHGDTDEHVGRERRQR